MGQADSITNVGIYGLRIFNAYQKKIIEIFLEETTQNYVEEDNIKFLLTQFINCLATTAIPKYFDEYLNSNNTLFLNSSTLKNYLSKVIIIFKDKFPNHCALEETEWTKSISGEEFEKKCKREQSRGNVDVSEDTKHGLYSKASPWINAIDDHWMSNIDL